MRKLVDEFCSTPASVASEPEPQSDRVYVSSVSDTCLAEKWLGDHELEDTCGCMGRVHQSCEEPHEMASEAHARNQEQQKRMFRDLDGLSEKRLQNREARPGDQEDFEFIKFRDILPMYGGDVNKTESVVAKLHFIPDENLPDDKGERLYIIRSNVSFSTLSVVVKLDFILPMYGCRARHLEVLYIHTCIHT